MDRERNASRTAQVAGLCGSFALAALASLVVFVNASGDGAHPTRFTMELFALILLHALRYLRLWMGREILLYLLLIGYTFLTLLWTDDIPTAAESVPSIVNFVLVLVLFASLSAYHDLGALLAGLFAGFIVAAVTYTITSGFPFSYPEDFSYNTIAGMYLSGLFISLLFSAYMRLTILPLGLGAVLVVLIAATTSIKTNLGLALGVAGAVLLYSRVSMSGLVKTAISVAVLGGIVMHFASSSQQLTERVQHGLERVSTGFSVLTNREGDTGAVGLATRQTWEREGLKGWGDTPVFGHGFEAFRSDFSITSHSTPIDLLYNAGLVGFGLFYGIFASIAWRLFTARNAHLRRVRALIAGCLIAYTFISISGIIYFLPFVAIFTTVSAGLLIRTEPSVGRDRKWWRGVNHEARSSASAD